MFEHPAPATTALAVVPHHPLIQIEPSDAGGTTAIDLAIAAWLHAKYRRTRSDRTKRAYEDTLASFRAAAQQQMVIVDQEVRALDLDGDPGLLALIAQQWASAGDISASTQNHRLAVVSSFYVYVLRQGLFAGVNPIDRVERSPIQAYASAQPIAVDELKRRMREILRYSPETAPQEVVQRLRDFALLSVGVVTGRRLSELAGLRWRAVDREGTGQNVRVTLTWERAKGAKVMRDTLPASVGRALLNYLETLYGPQLDILADDAPVWVSFSLRNKGAALGTQTIADICERWLGTSKVHTLRHTFARSMEEAGAKLSDIQARLGHNSLATTGLYLAALKQAENQHGDALASMFGFD